MKSTKKILAVLLPAARTLAARWQVRASPDEAGEQYAARLEQEIQKLVPLCGASHEATAAEVVSHARIRLEQNERTIQSLVASLRAESSAANEARLLSLLDPHRGPVLRALVRAASGALDRLRDADWGAPADTVRRTAAEALASGEARGELTALGLLTILVTRRAGYNLQSCRSCEHLVAGPGNVPRCRRYDEPLDPDVSSQGRPAWCRGWVLVGGKVPRCGHCVEYVDDLVSYRTSEIGTGCRALRKLVSGPRARPLPDCPGFQRRASPRGPADRPPANLDTLGKRHTLNEVGDCVAWCAACRENTAAGLHPDGTKPDPSPTEAARTTSLSQRVAEMEEILLDLNDVLTEAKGLCSFAREPAAVEVSKARGRMEEAARKYRRALVRHQLACSHPPSSIREASTTPPTRLCGDCGLAEMQSGVNPHYRLLGREISKVPVLPAADAKSWVRGRSLRPHEALRLRQELEASSGDPERWLREIYSE